MSNATKHLSSFWPAHARTVPGPYIGTYVFSPAAQRCRASISGVPLTIILFTNLSQSAPGRTTFLKGYDAFTQYLWVFSSRHFRYRRIWVGPFGSEQS